MCGSRESGTNTARWTRVPSERMPMFGNRLFRLILIICFHVLALSIAHAGNKADVGTTESWTFAVSGDSRNCGNVVMPAIASAVKKNGDAFYWHLGDYRAIYKFDEDYLAESSIRRDGKDPTISGYLGGAWDDFISHQLAPFADVPVYLAAGNHETIPPKTHDEYVKKFLVWFDKPEIRTQRIKDNPLASSPKSYYHWTKGPVDFITLDNSVGDSF